MSVQRKYDPTQKDQVINTLRREILAARLKVTLDRKLGEKTSDLVKKLAGMDLPPSVQAESAQPEPEQDQEVPLRPSGLAGLASISPGWTNFQDLLRHSSGSADDQNYFVSTIVSVPKEEAGTPLDVARRSSWIQRE